MYKNLIAYPASASPLNELLVSQLDCLSLVSRKSSETDTISGGIFADCAHLPSHSKKSKLVKKLKKKPSTDSDKVVLTKKKRQNTIKKLKYQQSRIQQLERQIHSLRRNCQNCRYCNNNSQQAPRIPEQFSDACLQSQLEHSASGCNQRRNSRQSIEFQAIDFAQNLAFQDGADDRAWVMLGTMMIIMGSKNMEIDGTINTFKIINDCVDSVRRQVEKSMERLSVDFYFLKQQMKEPGFMEGLDFDPFFTKTDKTGLNLQGLSVESIDQFQLLYDEKIKFSVDYESLLTTIQHLRYKCWIHH